MGYSRRSLLKRSGMTAVATAIAIAGLPDVHPEQRPERPVSPHDGEIPRIYDEAENGYALYQYSRERDGYDPKSPINVVVALAGTDTTFDEVMAVFWEAGWVNQPAEYVRYAYNARFDRYERQHATAAQTFFGGFGRHHIRAWDFHGNVSIQAHEDTAAAPEHEIASYESTRHLIEWLFHEAGWTVKPDGLWLDNATAPDHEGYVTVIEP